MHPQARTSTRNSSALNGLALVGQQLPFVVSDDVLDLAVTMSAEGLAEPQICGDQPIIEDLTRVGIPLDPNASPSGR